MALQEVPGQQSIGDRVAYSDAEMDARRRKLDYGVAPPQCRRGITGRRVLPRLLHVGYAFLDTASP